MNILKYVDYFHDGSLIDIKHEKNKIDLLISSSEMDLDDVIDDIELSNDNYITGILHLEEVVKIEINHKNFRGILKKEFDSGRICELLIKDNFIEISIDWINYPPNPDINEFSIINIEAKKIWWENLPNLEENLKTTS